MYIRQYVVCSDAQMLRCHQGERPSLQLIRCSRSRQTYQGPTLQEIHHADPCPALSWKHKQRLVRTLRHEAIQCLWISKFWCMGGSSTSVCRPAHDALARPVCVVLCLCLRLHRRLRGFLSLRRGRAMDSIQLLGSWELGEGRGVVPRVPFHAPMSHVPCSHVPSHVPSHVTASSPPR